MLQSTTCDSEPRHVAIIMDGNGRWVIRTGGEQRLREAVSAFRGRERRFGRVGSVAAH
jgi:hypothetical protein